MSSLLRKLIKEVIEDKKITFDNWKVPLEDKLKLEFQREHESKGNDFFDSEEDFINAVKNADIITVTNEDDKLIDYRSRTTDKEDLLDLISTYRSWKQGFRTKETFNAIYDGFMNNLPMELPIVIEFADGDRRVFSGNTRMDAAFHLGIEPKVLLVKSDRGSY
jgi:hypothetical protein